MMRNLTPTEKALVTNEIINGIKADEKLRRSTRKAALDKVEYINMLKELGLSEGDL